MKGIMATESTLIDQGVPSFSYYPADESTPLLFSLARPLDALKNDLLQTFAGQRLSMKEIFEKHNVDTPYIEKNYREALRSLEGENRIKCDPAAAKRRKNKGEVSFADRVIVTFAKE
jgi:hypothetical protein